MKTLGFFAFLSDTAQVREREREPHFISMEYGVIYFTFLWREERKRMENEIAGKILKSIQRKERTPGMFQSVPGIKRDIPFRKLLDLRKRDNHWDEFVPDKALNALDTSETMEMAFGAPVGGGGGGVPCPCAFGRQNTFETPIDPECEIGVLYRLPSARQTSVSDPSLTSSTRRWRKCFSKWFSKCTPRNTVRFSARIPWQNTEEVRIAVKETKKPSRYHFVSACKRFRQTMHCFRKGSYAEVVGEVKWKEGGTLSGEKSWRWTGHPKKVVNYSSEYLTKNFKISVRIVVSNTVYEYDVLQLRHRESINMFCIPHTGIEAYF